MKLTPLLFLLSLLTIGVQKARTGAEDNPAITESPIGIEDVKQLSINNNKSNSDNFPKGMERNDSRLYERKQEDQEKNYHWKGYLPDEAKIDFNYKSNNSKSNVSLNKENYGNNFTHSTHPSKEIPDLNYSLTKEKEILYHEQNSSFQSEYENNFNNSLQDEGVIFDWRRREDTYVITSPEEFPYSVLLVMYRKAKQRGICTGSIITEEWVLTASHCLDNSDEVFVYAGGNSLEEYNDYKMQLKPLPKTAQLLRSAEMIMHPLFTETSGDCDVGLIRVNGRFNMTKTVGVVRLTTTPWKRSYHTYTTCDLTGFGVVQMGEKRKDDAVRKTHRMEVKSPCLCSFRLQILVGTKVASRYICSKPKLDHGVCPGDSGSGLVCGGEVRAIAMQLIKLRDTNFCDMSLMAPMHCGGINTLSVFQDVCPFLPWVNKHVNLFNASEISKKCKYVSKSPRVRSSELLLLFSNIAVAVIKMFLLCVSSYFLLP